MIVLADYGDIDSIKQICANSAVGCKINCTLDCYRTDLPFAPFWKITEQGEILGVISKLDSAVTVLCKNKSAYAEAKEFIAMLPDVSEVLYGSGDGGAVMQLCGTPQKNSAEVSEAGARDILRIISHCKEIAPDERDKIYVDLSHRIRHGSLCGCAVFANGTPVCCACANVSGKDVLISTVFTLPEHRKKGYASDMIRYICNKFYGKNIYLLCEKELIDFYKNTGFSVIGGCTLESTVF